MQRQLASSPLRGPVEWLTFARFGMGDASPCPGQIVQWDYIAMRELPQFPIFTIASADGILVRRHKAKACVLLFENRWLAQAHIDELARLEIGFSLQTEKIDDGVALRKALTGLPDEVDCALWDSGSNPAQFDYVGIQTLLERVG